MRVKIVVQHEREVLTTQYI